MLRRLSWSSLVCALAVAGTLAGAPAAGRESPPPPVEVTVSELPREAGDTLVLIKSGGPFPFRKDGIVFMNRERRLPMQPRGYYTEYTVRTPGRADRGARRIIAGKGDTGSPATGGEYYYSDDHYETFRRIRE
jgi:ribonuclease T1